MEFTPLTVVAGPNGSGKSNLFDALQLLSDLAKMPLKEAFRKQRGELLEQFTQYDKDTYAQEMEFVVEMLVDRKIVSELGRELYVKNSRLRYRLKLKRETHPTGLENIQLVEEHLEGILADQDKWLSKLTPDQRKDWIISEPFNESVPPFLYTEEVDGEKSLMISRSEKFPNHKATPPIKIGPCKDAKRTLTSVVGLGLDVVDPVYSAQREMVSWSLTHFNPDNLRKPTNKRSGDDHLTSEGLNMAGALYRIALSDPYYLKVISRKVFSLLEKYNEVKVKDDKENHQYIIKLKSVDGKEYSASLVSEGTLRILALTILAIDEEHGGLTCLEEPENGIHPGRIKALAELLKDLSDDFSTPEFPLRQLIVNTHSPLLIGEMIRWKDDPLVSVHFAHLRSSVFTKEFDHGSKGKESKRVIVHTTNMLPVEKRVKKALHLLDPDQKLTIALVKEYLSTGDYSEALKILELK